MGDIVVVVVVPHGYCEFNSKSHDFLRHCDGKKRSVVKRWTLAETAAYIREYEQDATKHLVFYTQRRTQFDWDILDVLDSLDRDPLMTVSFFSFDYWPRGDQPYTRVMRRLLNAKRHRLLTFAPSVAHLEAMWGGGSNDLDLSLYQRNIVCGVNVWSCYDQACATVPEFNASPASENICVSGSLSPAHYPERVQVARLEHAETMKHVVSDEYCRQLSSHLSCFASSVHVRSASSGGGVINTHLVLLKVFEILASGALLVCPNTEKDALNALGLEDGKNCLIRPMSEMQSTIYWILDAANRTTVDEMRQRGYDMARTTLSAHARIKAIFELVQAEMKE